MVARTPPVTGRAKGGVARAKQLSATERKEIAKRAAASRWDGEGLPRAVCSSGDSPLRIADKALDCYVLEDETRVLSQAGFLQALGRHRRAATRSLEVPPMLQGKVLGNFLTPELLQEAQPVAFRLPNGLRASGYRASLLPKVCDVYLKARDAGKLPPNQVPVAAQADLLMRALAHVGIISLVDEATGYQDLRPRNQLAQILEQFIAKELRPWVQTFPADYYEQIFRLRGLDYPHDPVKRPRYFGSLTNDIVYKRLAPGVLEELKRVTPRSQSGRQKNKLHQWLTQNKGYPKLQMLLASEVTIMKLSSDWNDFMEKLDRLHPRYGTTLPLPLEFDYDRDQDDGNGI